jgi:uncharacterized protein (TIGR00251 family)
LASEAKGRWFDSSRARQPGLHTHPILNLKLLTIKVKPGARTSVLVAQDDGSWLAQVAAPPVDGAANEALIRLVAAHFGLRRAQVRLKSGATSRTKRIEIDD